MTVLVGHKTQVPVLTDANCSDTENALATAWISGSKYGLGPLLWEVCSDQGTELLDNRAVGRSEGLQSIRKSEEDIERFFSGKLLRQEHR